jgi:hypothetical protein
MTQETDLLCVLLILAYIHTTKTNSQTLVHYIIQILCTARNICANKKFLNKMEPLNIIPQTCIIQMKPLGAMLVLQLFSNNNLLTTLTVSLVQIILYLCVKKSSFDRIIWLHIMMENGVNCFTCCTFHVTWDDKVTQD